MRLKLSNNLKLRSCLKRGEKQLREQEFDIFHCYFFIDLPENEKLTMKNVKFSNVSLCLASLNTAS